MHISYVIVQKEVPGKEPGKIGDMRSALNQHPKSERLKKSLQREENSLGNS
jgi:hypothetical protein